MRWCDDRVVVETVEPVCDRWWFVGNGGLDWVEGVVSLEREWSWVGW